MSGVLRERLLVRVDCGDQPSQNIFFREARKRKYDGSKNNSLIIAFFSGEITIKIYIYCIGVCDRSSAVLGGGNTRRGGGAHSSVVSSGRSELCVVTRSSSGVFLRLFFRTCYGLCATRVW